MVPDQKYQNYLQLMEPENMNLSPREAPLLSSGCAKKQARLAIVKEQKSLGKVSYALFLNSDWPVVQV